MTENESTPPTAAMLAPAPAQRGRGPRLTEERLRTLLGEHGWEIVPGRYGGWRADSPVHHWRKPTPDWARNGRPPAPALWPSETYTELRQVIWQEYDGRLTLWIRESGAPWMGANMRSATQVAVRAYIEQHSREQVQRRMGEAHEAPSR